MTNAKRKTGRPKTGKAKIRRLIYFTLDNLRWLELRATKHNMSAGEFANLVLDSARLVEREGGATK